MKYALLALCFLCSQFAQADTDLGPIDKYMQASVAFETLLDERALMGEIPRLKDENVSVLLETLSNSKSVLETPNYTLNDFGTLLDVCEKANKFNMYYVMFDLKSAIVSTDSAENITAKTVDLMNSNIKKYQDELTMMQPFGVDCSAKQIALVEEFWLSLAESEKTSVRINGVKNMRKGMLQMYKGSVSAANDANYKMTYREALFQSVTDAAAAFALILPLEERETILTMMEQYSQINNGVFEEQVDIITSAMSSTVCHELCQLQ